ncbi:maltokinase N-terminal cap-like domain-containing protein [Actinophytocola gossypii]|uniref:Maltokinase n=1 Tax=Actinophytocola gossypii TaxID=2812003 RepID=A0ABT2JAV6_9PSEU|nr:aminoglycoside phosphotransferase [Actinophytocola gossypii]MCT2585002.1 aminoglycoside phosphotransferase [Actinophytocola gossypii]
MIRPEDLGEGLLTWLVEQRWFRAKARGATTVGTRGATALGHGLQHTMIEVDSDLYQLPLGARRDIPDHLTPAVITRLGDESVYDATQDTELMAHLLTLLADGATVDGLSFRTEPGVTLERDLRARPIGVEQSNTSIVYGARYILKLYRQPDPGPNRDVELHRALRSAGTPHIAAPLGVISEGDLVLGFLQEFLPNAVEGWATATASVRDLLAEGDLHADEVGGDFAGEAHRLGAAVADVHAALATETGTSAASPDEVDAEVDAMHARLDAALSEVPELAARERLLRSAFDAVRELREPLTVQQVHGDLHLGQVLRSNEGWVLIDFEGEPAAPLERRRAPRSPLRDVAAMLRSFDYAAFHLLGGEDTDRQLMARAEEWSDRNRAAFSAGYAEVAGDPTEQDTLLRALELDKAVYEVRYEHHNRPDWLPIPLAAIQRWSMP